MNEMSQKSEGLLVGDYMTTRMITIGQKHSLRDAACRMVERNVSSLAIIDQQDRIVGIFTERDVVRAISSRLTKDGTSVGDLMTRPVVSITKDATIEDAARTMALKNIRHLVVMEPHGQEAVGIITVTDLARYLRKNVANEQILDSEVWELFF